MDWPIFFLGGLILGATFVGGLWYVSRDDGR